MIKFAMWTAFRFADLSYEDKLEYLKNVTYIIMYVVGCSSVYVKVVYEGKVYYQCIYDYDYTFLVADFAIGEGNGRHLKCTLIPEYKKAR